MELVHQDAPLRNWRMPWAPCSQRNYWAQLGMFEHGGHMVVTCGPRGACRLVCNRKNHELFLFCDS